MSEAFELNLWGDFANLGDDSLHAQWTPLLNLFRAFQAQMLENPQEGADQGLDYCRAMMYSAGTHLSVRN